MCHAVPAEVEEVFPERKKAIVNLGAVRKEVSIELLEEVNSGDIVLIHVGFALSKLDPEEAEKTRALMEQNSINDGDASSQVAA